ncbi:Hypothetical protein POVR1_LOCUS542 [uncultured virus]|nr:Hypothetical protein POVR1_LOCUS542 [uncultured virus]
MSQDTELENSLAIVRKVRKIHRMADFKKFISDIGVSLTFRGKFYTAEEIEKICNLEHRTGCCQHCGYGQFTRYAVKANDSAYFVIEKEDGCATYSGEDPEVKDFNTKPEMVRYLNSVNYEKEELSDELPAALELKEFIRESLQTV